MDWMVVAGETIAVILSAAVMAAAGWIGRSIRSLRREIAAFQAASDKRLDAVEKQLVQVEELERHNVIERLGKVEVELASAVKSAELMQIHERISERARESSAIRSEVSGVAGEVRAIHQSVNTIVAHLIEKGGNA